LQSLLNFEEQERHSRNPQPFDESVLHTLLDNSLPETDELDQCKAVTIVFHNTNIIYFKWNISHCYAFVIYTVHFMLFLHGQIMVPMVSRGHWTLYVVNTVKKCIHILDSNPYGTTLGGTTWKDYHFAPWAKVIMSRLNKGIQHVRPRTCFPKFGNFAIDLCPNCPNMAAGSNDCGFYVMGYILFYECDKGSLRSDIEAVRTNLPVNSIFGTMQHMVQIYT
jgi:hypothetical protein